MMPYRRHERPVGENDHLGLRAQPGAEHVLAGHRGPRSRHLAHRLLAREVFDAAYGGEAVAVRDASTRIVRQFDD